MREFTLKYKDEEVKVREMTSEEFYQEFRAKEGINLAIFDWEGRMVFGAHIDEIICDFCNREIPRSGAEKVFLIGESLLYCEKCFQEFKIRGGAR